MRALSQSLAKEFKHDDIHVRLDHAIRTCILLKSPFVEVSHAIIDGGIMTDRRKDSFGDEWSAGKVNDDKRRLHPASIAKVE